MKDASCVWEEPKLGFSYNARWEWRGFTENDLKSRVLIRLNSGMAHPRALSMRRGLTFPGSLNISRVEMRSVGVDYTKIPPQGAIVSREINFKSRLMVAEGSSRVPTRTPLVGKRFHVIRRWFEDLPLGGVTVLAGSGCTVRTGICVE